MNKDNKNNKVGRRRLKLSLIITASVLAFFILSSQIAGIAVYEVIFNRRIEPVEWQSFSVSDFEGVFAKRKTFANDRGETLVGYVYSTQGDTSEGLVVFSHGMGSGGHVAYMPLIVALVNEGYTVFAYDATANGESEGESLRGLPQGISDLNSAIDFIKEDNQYTSLPLFLVGHSWGAYSAGSALAFHNDVEAAVLISGFDSSMSMMVNDAKEYVGEPIMLISKPFLKLYDRFKFGKLSDASVYKGVSGSDAYVLVVHSSDDVDAPVDIGYNMLYEDFSESERVDFLLYEDRGHGYIYYSANSALYRDSLNKKYEQYVSENGGKDDDKLESEFMKDELDRDAFFEVDAELIERIEQTFKKSSQG